MLPLVTTLAALAAIIAGAWWWRSRAFDRFFTKVTARLSELGLVAHRLPDAAARHLATESVALFGAKRDFEPRRLAMRFFTWYAV